MHYLIGISNAIQQRIKNTQDFNLNEFCISLF
jgi:hypothetical protein